MKRQSGFIPAFLLPYIGYAVAGLAVVALLTYGVHRYNESVRKPLMQEIQFFKDSIAAQKKHAAEILAQRDKDNATALQGYVDYARKSDDQASKQTATRTAALNAANGVRFYDPGRGPSGSLAGQAATSGAGQSQDATATGFISEFAADFLKRQASLADQVADYAASCHAFVNEK